MGLIATIVVISYITYQIINITTQTNVNVIIDHAKKPQEQSILTGSPKSRIIYPMEWVILQQEQPGLHGRYRLDWHIQKIYDSS